jgi:tripartite-type tricarboxylate transporter receptor subunit TctC
MTSTRRRVLSLTVAIVAIVASLSSLAIAQEFPTRSIELVVPYPPGGSSDALARALAPTLEKELGQTIVVVNKPGAGGIVAGTLVAKSKPDGYSILIASSTALVLSPRLQQVDYDSLKDFTYVSLVARLIPMVLVRSDAPWKTLEDLVAYAKNNPGKIRYGTSGPHSGTHIAMESIAKEKGLSWVHVPFKGDGAVITGILGGHIEAAGVFSVYKPQVAAGKLRPLVSLMDKRTKHFPEVPTYKELGFKFDTRGSIQSITGIIAPAKLPPAIVARYEAALKKAVDSPEFAKTIETLGMEADFRPAAEYRREMEEGYHNAGRMLKDVGIVK